MTGRSSSVSEIKKAIKEAGYANYVSSDSNEMR